MSKQRYIIVAHTYDKRGRLISYATNGKVNKMPKKRYIITAHTYDKKGRLLSVAQNSWTKTHPFQAYLAKKVGHPEREFLHAEILACLRAKERQIHTLKIWRYGKDGQLLCAKPCPICQEAILVFGIPNVWYSDHNTMIRLSSPPL